MPNLQDMQPANAAEVYKWQRVQKAIANQPTSEQYDPGTLMVVVVATSLIIDPMLHSNKMLQIDSPTDVTLTLPATAQIGFNFLLDQVGAGKAILATASGATKVNRANHDRTAGAGAQLSVYVRSNTTGSAAVYAIAGDGAVS